MCLAEKPTRGLGFGVWGLGFGVWALPGCITAEEFWALAGGRWTSWKEVLIDLGIALPFWVLWTGAAYGVHWLLGASSAKTVNSLLPQSLTEVLIWIGASITAGVCEEMAFRGYVQRQLHALSGSVVVAGVGAGVGLWPISRIPGLEERDRDQRAWSPVWSAGRLAREPARQHCRPCLDRLLGRLV